MLNSRYNFEINTTMNLLNGVSDGSVKWANVDRYYHDTKKISVKMRLWKRPRNRPVTSTMKRINSTIKKREVLLSTMVEIETRIMKKFEHDFSFFSFLFAMKLSVSIIYFFCKVFFFSGSTSTASDVIVDAQERV
jgi:hypothetical protein